MPRRSEQELLALADEFFYFRIGRLALLRRPWIEHIPLHFGTYKRIFWRFAWFYRRRR